jgi:CheY-like chemotaxis protein
MNKSILIVDYDSNYRTSLSNMLKNMGFEIFSTGNPDEALEIARYNNIDIAVIDCISEDNDTGFVLAYRLKKLFPFLPVIIISSMSETTGIYFNPESERERKWLNADVYLSKDVSTENLLKEIFKLLKLNK